MPFRGTAAIPPGSKIIDALILSLQKFFLYLLEALKLSYIQNSLGQKPQNAHSWVTICSVSALEFSKLSKVTFFLNPVAWFYSRDDHKIGIRNDLKQIFMVFKMEK